MAKKVSITFFVIIAILFFNMKYSVASNDYLTKVECEDLTSQFENDNDDKLVSNDDCNAENIDETEEHLESKYNDTKISEEYTETQICEKKVYYSESYSNNGWYIENNNSYYYSESGELYTGLNNIAGKEYYFDKQGVMQRGKIINVNGQLMYFSLTDGTRVRNDCWVNRNKSYVDSTTGCVVIGIHTIDGKQYYFDENGIIVKGLYKEINGNGYYFDKQGVMQKGKIINVNGRLMYFSLTDGTRVRNDCWVNRNKSYVDSATGCVVIGIHTIDGKQYYFNQNGVIQKSSEFTLNGVNYITDSNGVVSVVQTVSNEPYRYYYNQLDDKAKILYDEIVDHLDAIKSGVDSIILSNKVNEYAQAHGIDSFFDGVMQDAVDAFNLDYADVFYWDCTKTGLSRSGYTHYFKACNGASNFLEDEFNSAAKVEIACNKVDTKINQIMSGISSDSTDYEIVAIVHDWLVDNLDYDYTFSTNCHNVYGTLVESKPVCEGYARTFKTLMDKYDIACIIVTGTGVNSTSSGAHAWNYVQLDGEWYAMDVTWDDPTIGGSGTPSQEWLNQIHHSYFLKGANDTNFMNSHILDDDFDVPTLNGSDYAGAA